MMSLEPLSKEQYYAKKLGEAYTNNNSNVIDIHSVSYWKEQLKNEHWRQFQQEQGRKEFEHVDKEIYNICRKAFGDMFKGLKN